MSRGLVRQAGHTIARMVRDQATEQVTNERKAQAGQADHPAERFPAVKRATALGRRGEAHLPTRRGPHGRSVQRAIYLGGDPQLVQRVRALLDECRAAGAREVVLADGRVVRTHETHEPDLFWAIRGGGGNFGVVTSLRVRLHPVADVSAGVITFPWEQARSVFKAYDDMVATIPDELTLTPGFFPGPDGKPFVIMLHAWCGDRREDQRVLDEVKGLGAPSMVQVRRTSPAQMLKDADPIVLNGENWIIRTVTLAKLEPGAVEALIDGVEHRSSPLSRIALHPFHRGRSAHPSGIDGLRPQGAPLHARDLRRLGARRGCSAPGLGRRGRGRAEALCAAERYPNYFGPDRPEQAAQAYGQNTARLLRIKAHYDPNGVFAATSLPVLA